MFFGKKIATVFGSVCLATMMMSAPVMADDMPLGASDWSELVSPNVRYSANIRSAGSMSADVIGSFSKGEVAEILYEDGDWTKVYTEDGVTGYVYTDLLLSGSAAKSAYEGTSSSGYSSESSSTSSSDSSSSYSRYNASSYEVNLLGAIIQCEAGGESYEGKVAVGAVVLNRVHSSSFPSTISDVIYESGQFTPASSGSLSSVLSSGVRSDCIEAAKDALNGYNPVEGCLYFRSGQHSGIVIGNQTFR